MASTNTMGCTRMGLTASFTGLSAVQGHNHAILWRGPMLLLDIVYLLRSRNTNAHGHLGPTIDCIDYHISAL